MPTTRLYETGVGQWAPERKREHRNVLGGLLRPAVGPGAVYVLLGLPGSGKTSVLRPAVLAHSGVPPLVSDADEVRVALPEFRRGLGSAILQEETAALVYGATGYPPGGGLQDRVLAAGGVALLDVVGDPRYLPATVAACRSWGSRVFLLLAECPTEACVERAMRRAVIDGRYVPLDYIRAKEGVPRQALDVALAEGPVDGWAVVDTSGAPARLLDGDGAFSAVLAAA